MHVCGPLSRTYTKTIRTDRCLESPLTSLSRRSVRLAISCLACGHWVLLSWDFSGSLCCSAQSCSSYGSWWFGERELPVSSTHATLPIPNPSRPGVRRACPIAGKNGPFQQTAQKPLQLAPQRQSSGVACLSYAVSFTAQISWFRPWPKKRPTSGLDTGGRVMVDAHCSSSQQTKAPSMGSLYNERWSRSKYAGFCFLCPPLNLSISLQDKREELF